MHHGSRVVCSVSSPALHASGITFAVHACSVHHNAATDDVVGAGQLNVVVENHARASAFVVGGEVTTGTAVVADEPDFTALAGGDPGPNEMCPRKLSYISR